jgi:adenosylcobinamide-phosphate synthase
VPTDLLILYGAFLVVVVTILAVMGALAAQAAAGRLPWPFRVLAQAWLLKCCFSLRGLVAAVWDVRDRLAAGDLEGARAAVGRHLVSRPVDGLDEGATASAAVESLAENLSDSWVAPLCFYLVCGVPGAWAYRAVNTADAMIGYRLGMLERLGGASARLDDLLNLVPSRFAALALVAGARIGDESGSRAWKVWCRDGGSTASPNAGQTMAAMAGALGVTLEKRGHYRLGDGPSPDVAVIDRAVGVFAAAAGVALVAGLALLRAFR